jgi:hypothetical protein
MGAILAAFQAPLQARHARKQALLILSLPQQFSSLRNALSSDK